MTRSTQIENAIKEKIIGSINVVLNEVFSNYFGVNVQADNRKQPDNFESDKRCLCQVHMQQEDVNMLMRFNFDANLLYRLVDETYNGEPVSDISPYNDAACEIANIVCCRVKAILNKSGYNLDMDLPHTIENNKLLNMSQAIQMYFSVGNSEGFFIDLLTEEQTKNNL